MLIEIEIEIVLLVVFMVFNIDKICFVNSGIEVCMSVIRFVCGYIGKEKFIKFVGCYYGYSDFFLI